MLETPYTGSSTGGRLARILRAAVWSLGGGLGAYALRIGNSLIMTRLLVPEMFGVMALASIIQIIIYMLSDLGLRQAVIQSPRGTEPDFLNTAWTIQVLRGSVIWIVCLVVSFALYAAQGQGWVGTETVYAAKVLPLVLAVSTFSSVINGLRSTRWIVSSRRLDLRALTLIELAAQFLGVIVMVTIGWYTRSIWALVAGGLITSAASVVLTSICISGMSNRLRWHADSAKELIGYGRWVLISSVFSVISANGDRLLLGAWVTPATLGFYVLAMNLNNIVIRLSARLFDSIGMPALSEVAREDPAAFPRAYRRMRRPFDIACLASAGVLFSLGQPLVDLMYDPRYAQSGAIVEILSFLLIFSRYGISTSAYLALGVPKLLTVINSVKLISIYTLIPLCYWLYGFTGAIWAIALHPLPTVPFIYWFNSKHRLNDFRYELAVTAWWPVGYVVGLGLAGMFQYLQI